MEFKVADGCTIACGGGRNELAQRSKRGIYYSEFRHQSITSTIWLQQLCVGMCDPRLLRPEGELCPKGR